MLSLNEILFPDDLENSLEENLKKDFSVMDLIKHYEQLEVENLEKKCQSIQKKDNFLQPLRKTKQAKKLEKEEKMKSLNQWGNIAKKQRTDEDNADLKILQLRKSLDPKVSYKNAQETKHDYFQIGTVMGSRLEGNQGFLKKVDKGQRIMDQFKIQDAQIDKSKSKYYQLQDQRMSKSQNKKWQRVKRIKMEQNKVNINIGKVKLD